jgi:hypothetical protein
MLQPTHSLHEQLMYFTLSADFHRKGQLAVALFITRRAKETGLPIDPDRLLTKSGGQISGLNGRAIAEILASHGVRPISAEGGRTSRGSLYYMRKYVDFLNDLLPEAPDLDQIEKYWAERVKINLDNNPAWEYS